MTIGQGAKVPLALLTGGGAVTLYLLFIGLPLIALLFRALEQDSFLEAMTGSHAMTGLRLSLFTSAISMGVVVAIGTPFAYLLARVDRPVVRLLDTLVELPLVLPPVVAGLAMLMAFGRQGFLGKWLEPLGVSIPFTVTAVVFAQMFVAAPFYIRSLRLGFQAVPRELEELSETLGVSPSRTFMRITLPLVRPSLLGGLALAWARAISEFGATMMFAGNFPGRTQTMPLAILTALESDLSVALAMAVLLTAVSVGILVALGLLGVAYRRDSQ